MDPKSEACATFHQTLTGMDLGDVKITHCECVDVDAEHVLYARGQCATHEVGLGTRVRELTSTDAAQAALRVGVALRWNAECRKHGNYPKPGSDEWREVAAAASKPWVPA